MSIWMILFTILAAYNVITLIKKWLTDKARAGSLATYKQYINKWDLEEIYVTADGTKIFGYKNPLLLPANRAISAEIAANQAAMKITRPQLEGMIEAMVQAGNEGEIVELFGYLYSLKDRLTWAAEEETLRNLANIYLLVEGENPEIIEKKFDKQKRQLMEEDLQARAFFLQYALKRTSDYSDISETDILRYLTAKAAPGRRSPA